MNKKTNVTQEPKIANLSEFNVTESAFPVIFESAEMNKIEPLVNFIYI